MLMKRNELFVHANISGEHFLIPTGQANADLRKAVSVNDTGIFIWETLRDEMSEEHLMRLVLEKYSPDRNDAAEVTGDVYSFLAHLKALGLIIDDNEPVGRDLPVNTDLMIAGIGIRIKSEEDILYPAFIPYKHEGLSSCDITIRFRIGLPAYTENGTVLLRNSEVTIIDTGKTYILIYPEMERVKEIHIDKSFKEANIFAVPPYDDKLKKEIYLAIRTPFLLMSLKKGAVMLHSSSVLYDGELVLFSAQSGVGKSTHAALWESVYGTPVINGDLNLLKPEGNQIMSYGTPWCGTSGISDNNTYPVRAILFLKRLDHNEFKAVSGAECILKLLSRCITPMWTESLSRDVLDICTQTEKSVKCGILGCTPTPEAAVCAMDAVYRRDE